MAGIGGKLSETALTWRYVGPGINHVLSHLDRGLDYERYMLMYNRVSAYCTRFYQDAADWDPRAGSPDDPSLFHLLQGLLVKHVRKLRSDVLGRPGSSCCDAYAMHWRRYQASAAVINALCSELNYFWRVLPGDSLCMAVWREEMVAGAASRITEGLLELVRRERCGEPADLSGIRETVQSLLYLGSGPGQTDLYGLHLEGPLLAATKDFYTAEAHSRLAVRGVQGYMRGVEARLLEEQDRVARCLDPRTLQPLMAVCEACLVGLNAPMLYAAFPDMLERNQADDFALLYTLLSRVRDGLSEMRQDYERYVRVEGLRAVEYVAAEAEKEPFRFVEAVLAVHDKHQGLVRNAFRADSGLAEALGRACRHFFNRNALCQGTGSRAPELLARFCDSKLKKGPHQAEDADAEEVQRRAVTVFRYLDDRDVFQRFYAKMLARRLIQGTSVSEEAEEAMISKLKEACGVAYTAKLHRMINDMQTSGDLNAQFKTTSGRGVLAMDLSVLVLCAASWPLSPPSYAMAVSPAMERGLSLFQQFYQARHSGRRLHWLHHLSRGELAATYLGQGRSAVTFQVSTPQMAVLLQYNDAEVYSAGELGAATRMPESIVSQILEHLVKARVLLEEEGPVYRLNRGYRSKKVRVNLNVPLKAEQRQEREETHQHVQEDRRLLTQAAIVRVMKTRKTLDYSNLVGEVIGQLQARFKPSVPDIKRAIDLLIEKEYLERAAGEKNTFHYLA